jgi:hypothetical protein
MVASRRFDPVLGLARESQLSEVASPRNQIFPVTQAQDCAGCADLGGTLSSKWGRNSKQSGQAKAHHVLPGSKFGATLNGRKQQLIIVGIAPSPQFI